MKNNRPTEFYKKIEFDKIINLLKESCISDLAANYFDQIEVQFDKEAVKLLLKETNEFLKGKKLGNPLPLRHYEAIGDDISLLRKEGFVLEVDAIKKIYHLVIGANEIINYFTEENKKFYPILYIIVEDLKIDPKLIKEIDRVLDDQGNVRPNASEKLQKVSRLIHNKERELDKVFSQELSFLNAKGYLSDTKESMRNGRRVFTVNAEHKRQIEGLIHDESATGKTVFIESAPLISLNNEIFNLYTERKKEIYKILRDLCTFLRPFADDFLIIESIHVKYDTIRAKANLALEMDAKMPKVVKKVTFKYLESYNPLLLLKNMKAGMETVPFTLELFGINRMVVLSGPNAGGKSVAMKSVGLLQIMVQCGLLVPVDENSEFGIFHKFFADIGDQQSMDDDLSTYSSHLKNMKEVIDKADDRSLVLFDEFGSGTDPKMGGAIAEAILKDLAKRKCFGMVTTHYSSLKFFAYRTQGVVNASMEFNQELFNPTFQLNIGKPGSSFAFEIATKSGLPNHVIEYAKKKTGKEELALDQVLVNLQAERRELEEKMKVLMDKEEKLNKLTTTYETLHREIEFARKQVKLEKQQNILLLSQERKSQAKKLENQFASIKKSTEASKLIEKIKLEEKKAAESINEIKHQIYKADQSAGKLNFKEGDTVKLRSGGGEGRLVRIDKDRAEVEMGFLKLWVPIIELLPTEVKEQYAINNKAFKSNVYIDDKFDTNLDIRGYSAKEAEEFLQKFLDDALLNDAFELKIIHGVGNGVLKKLVNKKAKEYKDIKKKWHPEENQGGEGVTMIQM